MPDNTEKTPGRSTIGLSRAATLIFLLVGLLVGGVALTIGTKLAGIEERANETSSVIIPQSISQNRRALATESLTRFAAQIVAAPTAEARAQILAQVVTIATALKSSGAGAGQSIKTALAAIAAAVVDADSSERLVAEVETELVRATKIIKEIDDNLASIADDSASQLEELIEELNEAEWDDLPFIARNLNELSNINAVTQKLLTTVRDSRAMLTAAAALTDRLELSTNAEKFGANLSRLNFLVNNLPSTGDYEYLSPLIEEFTTLAVIFDMRRKALDKQDSAVRRSDVAIAQFSALSETISTDAANIAVESVEAISRSATEIKKTALVALGFLVVMTFLIAWLGRRHLILRLVEATEVLDELSLGKTDVGMAPARLRELDSVRRSMDRFRDTMLENAKMTSEKEAAKYAQQREQERLAQAERDAKIQAEIDATVRAAVRGDFSKRVDTTAAQGVMRDLSEGMNMLLDVVDSGLAETVEVVSAMAQGDMTQRMQGDYQGAFARLKEDTNTMAGQIETIAGRISSVTGSVRGATQEIAAGISDLSARTEHQASSLEETTASMEELSTTVRQNADNAQEANQVSEAARDTAVSGGEVAEKAVSAMGKIEESSRQITDIVGLIQEIAFQTNLLALNASVEAARAGDAGRGFAVVANEVRALAQRAATASKEIKTLITNSDNQVKAGVELVNQAGASLGEIVTSVKKVADFVSEIAAASQEQSSGIEQVSNAITNMDEMTQQNASLVEETTAALNSAQTQLEDLGKAVGFFKTAQQMQAKPHAADAHDLPAANPVAEQKRTLARRVSGGGAAAAAAVQSDEDWQEF